MPPQRLLLDIHTQRDFFDPAGSCYAPAAAPAARNIRRLFAWARACRIPVLSTVLRVRRGQHGPLSDRPHCLEGTEGEAKLRKTLLANRIDLGLLNTTDLPVHIFREYQQVIIEMRHADLLGHARAERLITELPPATFVICGAGLTRGVFQAAVGLRARAFGVIVASDAVLHTSGEDPGMALRRMEAKGVVFAPTAEIIQPTVRPRPRPFRSPEPAGRQVI